MNDVDVPEMCSEVKAWFKDRPSREVIIEIKDWIKAGNQPHLWRGHTHTKPQVGARVVYLDDFDLSEKLIKSRRLAPCPCCTPKHPKYGKGGKIAWFPDEGVIRLLGPQCFAALNPEGHNAAMEELKARRRREQDIQRLIELREPSAKLHSEICDTIPIAAKLDKFSLHWPKR